MADENFAMVICADPQLKKHFLDQTDQAVWLIPDTYENEIKEILETNISILPNIDSPEDYKMLIQAMCVLKTCKERLAIIRHHLKGLQYRWDRLHKEALKFIGTKYYVQLNAVRDSTRKQLLIDSLEPITSGVEKLDYLLEVAEAAQKHLEDINWAIRNSSEMISNYFGAMRVVAPAILKEI